MAEFSKQYEEAFNFDWHDFDYAEIWEKLQPNEFYPLICEGLGTLGVGRSESGEMLLGIQDDQDPSMMIFKTLDQVISLVESQGRE
jgi:hypothetical protein